MAQDPEELFDLCDANGLPTGAIKPRGLVHRDGDWHRSFHCWIVSAKSGRPELIMQRRSPDKDTWGGRWDVSVGGHYAAGEGIEGGLREIEEELGIQVALDELTPAARRRDETWHPNSLIDREVQDVFFLRRDLDVGSLRPSPLEVTALASVPADKLSHVAAGKIESIIVEGIELCQNGDWAHATFSIGQESLVPGKGQYYEKAARFAANLVHERPALRHLVWW